MAGGHHPNRNPGECGGPSRTSQAGPVWPFITNVDLCTQVEGTWSAPPWPYIPPLPHLGDAEDGTQIRTSSVKVHPKVPGPGIDPSTSQTPHTFPASILPGREAPYHKLIVARSSDPGVKGVREDRPANAPQKEG